MAAFELPDMPTPKVTPYLLMGAASPLWSYFGAAAAGGVAYWWMTRWTQPVNLEALFGKAVAGPASPVALEAAVEPVVEAVEAVAEPVTKVAEATAEAVETAVDSTIESVEQAVAAGAETVAEALPDAALPEMPVGGEAAPISPLVEVLAAPEPEPASEPEPAPEPPMEATADPIPEPAAKPRGRKSPANGLEA